MIPVDTSARVDCTVNPALRTPRLIVAGGKAISDRLPR